MLDQVINIAIQAGILILKRRATAIASFKSDGSPVTCADIDSSNYIENGLSKSFGIPVISEESKNIPSGTQEKFFLVDPLDGTKDFLAGFDDFSVNIALIENKSPILGVIYAPALNELFYAERSKGSYVKKNNVIKKLPSFQNSELIIAKSRFHETPMTDSFIKKNEIKKEIIIGSSLKLCRIAEGQVNLYIRYAPTKEWDIAAGHIIIKESGGNIINLKNLKEFSYNKPSFINDGFLAYSGGGELVDVKRIKF